MKVNWEKRDDKILRYMSIPAEKKLEWLYKIHEFTLKFTSERRKKLFWKLREKQ